MFKVVESKSKSLQGQLFWQAEATTMTLAMMCPWYGLQYGVTGWCIKSGTCLHHTGQAIGQVRSVISVSQSLQ